jgi:hypothetical protein
VTGDEGGLYEQRVNAYELVDHNAHDEALENHLATNLPIAWAKAAGTTLSQIYIARELAVLLRLLRLQ